jgi:DNA-directed RNA polymerase specialized sigma24 family protein
MDRIFFNPGSQEDFEERVILESELHFTRKENSEYSETTMDTLTIYNDLDTLYSEYGRDVDFEFRKNLKLFIDVVFSQLTKEELELIKLKHQDNLSYREIGLKLNKPVSTVFAQMKKIEEKIRLVAKRS